MILKLISLIVFTVTVSITVSFSLPKPVILTISTVCTFNRSYHYVVSAFVLYAVT